MNDSADAPAADFDPTAAIEPDPVLLAAQGLARSALAEITPAATVGAYSGYIVHGEHLLSLQFESNMSGYPDWFWTVGLSRIDADSAANVLETELIPGEDSLVAPDWIPWSERLADYRLAQEHAALLASTAADLDDDDDLDDDLDESDLDVDDLDDHILDDDLIDDGRDDDPGFDLPAGIDEAIALAPERDSYGNVDASIVIAQADRAPRRRRARNVRIDPSEKGVSVVELDVDAPTAGIYYDEEAANQDD